MTGDGLRVAVFSACGVAGLSNSLPIEPRWSETRNLDFCWIFQRVGAGITSGLSVTRE